jgi:hypothetical protein
VPVAATRSFYESQAATGTASEETEGWRDVCDTLFHELDKVGQKQVKSLERKLKKKIPGLLPVDLA